MVMLLNGLLNERRGQSRVMEAVLAAVIIFIVFSTSMFLMSSSRLWVLQERGDLDRLGYNLLHRLCESQVIEETVEKYNRSSWLYEMHLKTAIQRFLPPMTYFELTISSCDLDPDGVRISLTKIGVVSNIQEYAAPVDASASSEGINSEPVTKYDTTGIGSGHPISNTTWDAQAFKVPSNGRIGRVSVRMFADITGRTATIYVKIRSSLAGSDLSTGSLSTTLSKNNPEWFDINITPVDLNSGVQYWIIVHIGDANANVRWEINASGTYQDGYVARSIDKGKTWDTTTYAGSDAGFKLFNSYSPSNTIDDDIATFWQPNTSEVNASCRWELGALKTVAGLRVYWDSDIYYSPLGYNIQTSPDASIWTDQIIEIQRPQEGAWKFYSWSPANARYIRILITAQGFSGTRVCEAEYLPYSFSGSTEVSSTTFVYTSRTGNIYSLTLVLARGGEMG